MKITSEKIETSYKGYYPFVEKGLIVEMSKGQKRAYNSGEGGELRWKVIPHFNKGYIQLVPPKMCSMTSSSALVVNSFAEAAKLKSCESDYWNTLLFNGEDPFFCGQMKEACFEKKLKICGIKGFSPNVDFYLRVEDSVVAIESKYTEPFEPKIGKIQKQYETLIRDWEGKYPVVKALSAVIREIGKYTYLDVAQLVKHMLGLVSLSRYGHRKIKKFKLIYLYHPSVDEVNNGKHREEVNRFAKHFKMAKAESWFKAMTYKELFSNLNMIPGSKDHYNKLRSRYKDGIDCSLWDCDT